MATKRKRGPSLSVGRGEKLPASKGAGLTAKGRAKYNRATGSNLKPLPLTLRQLRLRHVKNRFAHVLRVGRASGARQHVEDGSVSSKNWGLATLVVKGLQCRRVVWL